MTLQELINLNLFGWCNIDLVGVDCKYEDESLICDSPAEQHSLYTVLNNDIPEEYLSYRVIRLYGNYDGLTVILGK